MKNIVIVEDDELIVKGLKEILKKIDADLSFFCTGFAAKALRYAEENHVDIFCLDIQLEDYNGIELAKKIRKINKYILTPIVFITAIPTRELIAFKETHCYDYIIKPFSYEEVFKTFETIILHGMLKNEFQPNEEAILKFKEKSCVYVVPQDDIISIESQLRRLHVVTVNEEFNTNTHSLTEVANELTTDFIQCHKSFFVNRNYIFGVDYGNKEIILKNKDKIPLGRTYIKKLKDAGYEQ